jgi:hypothetical protein
MHSRIAIVMILLAGCSSVEKRTKWSDKTMRIMVDPKSISHEDYVRIQQSLVDSGKWIVVDRANGFNAAKSEQERLHRGEADRYEDAEKYAMWGKMYGVGGIVVPDSQCMRITGWMTSHEHLNCLQTLTIIDANTAEVITSISHKEDGDLYIALSWDDAVDKMNSAFPKVFDSTKKTDRLAQYSKDAEANAKASKLKIDKVITSEGTIVDVPVRAGDHD